MRVCVTGAASHLAHALLPALCARPEVETVIGLDLRPTGFVHPKLTHYIADLRAPHHHWLAGCDALVHLAFVVLRGHMPAHTMRAINVEATQRLFETAARMGIARLVHLSSAAVYGHGENLTEDAPLSPLPGFLYAAHKAMLEAWFEDCLPQAVRLRPHAILGPCCQPLLRTLLRLPLGVALAKSSPRLQCVHEQDVVAAILAVLFAPGDVRGPYNLAAPGYFTLDDLGRRLRLPPPVARGLLYTAWRLTGFGGEPDWVAGLSHSLTLDCSRARLQLAWQPRHDVRATLAAIMAP
ncbi:NAD-dependent epimerase/dehydratase family protein [Thiobacter aerophilum]|uniref:NAD-dependent epimerase/dehydratase family protein n=1 Tax=Thiobacter aerophilum TaxID=3121275 RepID=A0ABV0EGP1_9BURK